VPFNVDSIALRASNLGLAKSGLKEFHTEETQAGSVHVLYFDLIRR